jgi:hypothetical protein
MPLSFIKNENFDLIDKIKENTDPYNRPKRYKKTINQFRNNRKFRRSK